MQLDKARALKFDKKKELIKLLKDKEIEYMVEQLYLEEVLQKVNYDKITHEQEKAYYEAHKKELLEKPDLMVAWILHESKDTLEKVRTLVLSSKFANLAKKYSQHDSKDKGGVRGWISSNDPFLGKYFSILLNYKIGEISQVLKLTPGKKKKVKYVIVKILDRKKPKPKPFKIARRNIRDILVNKGREKRFQELLTQLYEKYKVVEYPANLDKLKLKVRKDASSKPDKKIKKVKGITTPKRNVTNVTRKSIFKKPKIKFPKKGK